MNMRSCVHTLNPKGATMQVADVARLLSDPTRMRIIEVLFAHPEGMCVYEIAGEVGSSPSATSHQLARLEDRGIVRSYREGQKVCYALLTNAPLVGRIKKILHLFS